MKLSASLVSCNDIYESGEEHQFSTFWVIVVFSGLIIFSNWDSNLKTVFNSYKSVHGVRSRVMHYFDADEKVFYITS